MAAASTIESYTLSADCKTLTILYDAPPDSTATITNETSGATIDAATSGNVIGDVWTVTPDDISLSGILNLMINGVTFEWVIGTCELQCCVAGLLQSSIDCACKCSKCDDDLRKAQKIHLLSESAIYAVTNENITEAINKYNSAKSFCDETCGCGC
jgi:hypothetical protein